VGGQGGAGPDFTFGTLYRLRQWSHGRLTNELRSGRFLSRSENAANFSDEKQNSCARPSISRSKKCGATMAGHLARLCSARQNCRARLEPGHLHERPDGARGSHRHSGSLPPPQDISAGRLRALRQLRAVSDVSGGGLLGAAAEEFITPPHEGTRRRLVLTMIYYREVARPVSRARCP